MRSAVVIGGGIAGHGVAQFLHKTGWSVTIAEAAQGSQEYEGLFLNVATNGLAVLALLGLESAVLDHAHAAPLTIMRSSTGRVLGSVPNGPANHPDRGGAIIRRGTLQAILGAASDDAGIATVHGKRFSSYTESPDGVVATFEDGTTMRADVLLGADGIGSRVRHQLDPGAPGPTYTGLVGLGGYAHVPDVDPTPGAQYMLFGRRAFFGYLVRADHSAYWFANLTCDQPDRQLLSAVPSDRWLSHLRELHEGDPEPVGTLIENTSAKVGAYPIHQLGKVPLWSRGRAVLLGDAVHATSPSAGQGAALALEDAATLARCLDSSATLDEAFGAYERERAPRAERIATYARAVDKQKRVTRSAIGIRMRDAMMPFFLRQISRSTRNDALYNFDVGWDRERYPA